jgi:hypothetical protein
MHLAPHHPLPTAAPRGHWWLPVPGSFDSIALSCPCCGHMIMLRNRRGIRQPDLVTTRGMTSTVRCGWVACTAVIDRVVLEGWPTAKAVLIDINRPALVAAR